MGRKSREKKNRIRAGDTIEILEESFGRAAGFYYIREVCLDMIFYSVGEREGGFSKSTLPSYRKLTPCQVKHINWNEEQIKQEQYAKALYADENWEEVFLPGVSDNQDSFMTMKVRRLRVQ